LYDKIKKCKAPVHGNPKIDGIAIWERRFYQGIFNVFEKSGRM
jgi:hypothetical protein